MKMIKEQATADNRVYLAFVSSVFHPNSLWRNIQIRSERYTQSDFGGKKFKSLIEA